MLELANLLLPLPPTPHSSVSSSAAGDPSCSSSFPETLDGGGVDCNLTKDRAGLAVSGGSNGAEIDKFRRVGKKGAESRMTLNDHLRAWKERKMAAGAKERDCFLPFLANAKRLVDCRNCATPILPGEGEKCFIVGCQEVYHKTCANQQKEISNPKSFRCPQHHCLICKKKFHLRCARCPIAAHAKCAPWPFSSLDRQGRVICWKHPSDWRFDNENVIPATGVEEAFHRLPLPYSVEEFKLGSIFQDAMAAEKDPAPYIHIRRNVYLVKKKRDDAEIGVGCTNCNANSTCMEDCECRGLSVSCSRACHCSDSCRNRPFRKDKKIKVVKTEHCGWGAIALEVIKKGEFVVEYIGEVINDALCEQRLWDMKRRGDQNFYMCEIRKDFTIDATFKGNFSRFLNHSCDPNCSLEKWQVEGETRVGVFASRLIEVGEPLTYDYRFVHFGPMVKCYCGASNCQGYLGIKKKINDVLRFWGCKRRRSTMVITENN